MKSIHKFSNLFIHREFVDMRKSINGLSAIVSEEMDLDLKSNSLFIFTNRRWTHMKILYFDTSGFALWLKKLEASKFPWPKDLSESVVKISSEDMELLLSGVNVWTRFKKLDFEHVV